MEGHRNDEFGWRPRRAPRGLDDQCLQDPDGNGIDVREAGTRILEPLHPISDHARVGDRGQAGVELRDGRGVEIRLESVATPRAERFT